MSDRISERLATLFESGVQNSSDAWMPLLLKHGLDELPLPGQGDTLERWRALAAVGQLDLSLTKLYEGHTDALAIMAELQSQSQEPGAGVWCVWAAEAPGGRVIAQPGDDGSVALSGSKFWCSGATCADHALLTAWGENGSGPHLVAVDLHQSGITVDSSHWKAVGMAGSLSVNVRFENVQAQRIGGDKDYLTRPGFWQGGAGIAACWYGGAVGIATALRQSMLKSSANNASREIAMGKVELALAETAALLRHAASWIDTHPKADASQVALAARLSAEKCAKTVLDEVGRAMGPTPFCLDEKFAQAAADLPVFIRQSHGDRDFAALGERSLKQEASAWLL